MIEYIKLKWKLYWERKRCGLVGHKIDETNVCSECGWKNE